MALQCREEIRRLVLEFEGRVSEPTHLLKPELVKVAKLCGVKNAANKSKFQLAQELAAIGKEGTQVDLPPEEEVIPKRQPISISAPEFRGDCQGHVAQSLKLLGKSQLEQLRRPQLLTILQDCRGPLIGFMFRAKKAVLINAIKREIAHPTPVV